jgi:hypothetical protein
MPKGKIAIVTGASQVAETYPCAFSCRSYNSCHGYGSGCNRCVVAELKRGGNAIAVVGNVTVPLMLKI